MKYKLIHKESGYPALKWAEVFEVSTSAYYDWLKTKDERDRKGREYRAALIEIFEDSEGTCGVDRVCGCLRNKNYTASYDCVKRIMNELGLTSIHRRRRQRSLTDGKNAKHLNLPNLVKDLRITKPFQVLTSDIIYIRTSDGFDYFCSIRDVKSRIVLAESIQDNMRADLVVDAIRKAQIRWNLPQARFFTATGAASTCPSK